MSAQPSWRLLGTILLEQGLISADDLEGALEDQERTGRKLGEILVEAGYVSVEQVTTVLLEQCGIDMSTQDGFGSGLRDQLARRVPVHRREPEPVPVSRFAEEPEPQVQVQVQEQPQAEPEHGPIVMFDPKPRRRGLLRRDPNRALVERLEALVKDFDEQQRGLVENLANLRRMLAGIDG